MKTVSFINTFKITIASLFDGTLLFILAPILDHLFTPLDKNKSNNELLKEIILQIITLSFLWYVLDKFIFNRLHDLLNISHKPFMQKSFTVITSVVLIGLQSHLVNKLNYITHDRPFKLFKYFKDI